MRLTGVARRKASRVVFAVALILGFASGAFAQNPPAAQAAPAQQAEKKYVTFEGDVGELIVYVKPDKGADFEALMAKFKDALAKLNTPETKQQASSLKVLKAKVVEGAPNALYVLVADPPVKGSEYYFLAVLYKAFPEEAKAIQDKWTDIKGSVSATPLDLTVVK